MLRCLAALVGGVVLARPSSPWGSPWLMPVALAVLVLAVRGLGPRRRARSAGSSASPSCDPVWWMRAVGTDAWVALCVLQALYFAPLGIGLAW